jgi:hypothetical protein
MQFKQLTEGSWLLIDETAPSNANVIATVRGTVEVLALKGLCEAKLRGDESYRPYAFELANRRYEVTPYTDRGGRLSLRILGPDGFHGRVETEFKAEGNVPGS